MNELKPSTIGIIPVRLESSRLPGKALLDICGLTMIRHVYLRCLQSKLLDRVIVATDNERIADEIFGFNGEVIMTGSHHETGTDRIAEAAENLDCDIVVNIQGDEALVNPEYIDAVVEALHNNPDINVAILVNPYFKINNPSDIKAVVNENMEILYLSRSDIPSNSRTPQPPMLKAYHILPFRRQFLLEYASWSKGKLERIEYNEYLRILEKGHKIKAVEVQSDAVSVDTVDDLEFVRSRMPADPVYQKYKSYPFATK